MRASICSNLPKARLSHWRGTPGPWSVTDNTTRCGAEDLAGLGPATIVESGIPRVTYCDPEVASVGLTQRQAEDEFGTESVATVEYNLAGNGRSQILATTGFVKVVRQREGQGTGFVRSQQCWTRCAGDE